MKKLLESAENRYTRALLQVPASRNGIDRVGAATTSRAGGYFSSGALELLKWIALLSMLVDHVNVALFGSQLQAAQAFGRIAFPLFAVVFAYNLANGTAHTLNRAMRRLTIAGLISHIPFLLVFQDPLRLNIFFTFLVAAAAIALQPTQNARRAIAAALLIGLGGAFVDYLWFGVLFTLACYYVFQPGRTTREIVCVIGTALVVITSMQFALVGWPALATLCAAPVLHAAVGVNPAIPRSPRLFYWFYPAHLAVLGTIMLAASTHR